MITPVTTNPYGLNIRRYLEVNDVAPVTLRFRKKAAATAASVAFTVTAQYVSLAMATCVTSSVSVTTTGTSVSGVVKSLFGL